MHDFTTVDFFIYLFFFFLGGGGGIYGNASILDLLKLDSYGIRYNELKWFQMYSENRQQMVKVNKDTPSKLPLNFGVSQGSVPGPLLSCYL